VVAVDDVALVYAPRSASYEVTSDPTAWWQPVPSGQRYSPEAMATPIAMNQTYRGNLPQPMWIDVWNWRFLLGRRYADDAGVVEAKLKVAGNKVVGTIANRGGKALRDVEVHVPGKGVAKLAGAIAAGQSANVDVAIVQGSTRIVSPHERVYVNGVWQSPPDPISTYPAVFQMSAARTRSLESLGQGGGQLTVYAYVESPDTDVTITNPNAVARHVALLRATVKAEK
jgi:hypothetical protein